MLTSDRVHLPTWLVLSNIHHLRGKISKPLLRKQNLKERKENYMRFLFCISLNSECAQNFKMQRYIFEKSISCKMYKTKTQSPLNWI